jgi:hypothetical protein
VEELPKIIAYANQSKARGINVAFISLDDDERELSAFLQNNPAKLSSSFHLPPGELRRRWLSALGLGEDVPRLPLHLFVDSKGVVMCAVDGAIAQEDFTWIGKL